MKTIKKSIALLLALVMVLAIAPISAFAEDDALNYLEYKIENDEVTITGYKNDPVNLVIPAEIEGLPVTEIQDKWDSGVFGDCETLKRVVLPDSMIKIGEKAFSFCFSLEEIVLGDSLEYIGNHAFLGCPIESITLPDSLRYISFDAFAATILKEIHISDLAILCDLDGTLGTEFAGIKLYLNDSLLETVVIPDGMTKINDYLFRNISSIKKVLHGKLGDEDFTEGKAR